MIGLSAGIVPRLAHMDWRPTGADIPSTGEERGFVGSGSRPGLLAIRR
jgi:hypothetical protein